MLIPEFIPQQSTCMKLREATYQRLSYTDWHAYIWNKEHSHFYAILTDWYPAIRTNLPKYILY